MRVIARLRRHARLPVGALVPGFVAAPRTAQRTLVTAAINAGRRAAAQKAATPAMKMGCASVQSRGLKTIDSFHTHGTPPVAGV